MKRHITFYTYYDKLCHLQITQTYFNQRSIHIQRNYKMFRFSYFLISFSSFYFYFSFESNRREKFNQKRESTRIRKDSYLKTWILIIAARILSKTFLLDYSLFLWKLREFDSTEFILVFFFLMFLTENIKQVGKRYVIL